MTTIDTSFLFAALPPALQDINQRVLAATEYACYRGPHLKLRCGLLCLDLEDGEPAVAEIIGKGPGGDLMVRIRTLGTTGWLTRTRGEAMLCENGSLAWLGPRQEA
jgi:hypothetical protein